MSFCPCFIDIVYIVQFLIFTNLFLSFAAVQKISPTFATESLIRLIGHLAQTHKWVDCFRERFVASPFSYMKKERLCVTPNLSQLSSS